MANLELHQWRDVDFRGTVVRVDYTTTAQNGTPWAKYANVYLPYGYDEAKPYNILCLMHGGGGNPDAWLDCSQVKNALDRSFAEGRAKPFIVVFPTFYALLPGEFRKNGVKGEWENEQVKFFQTEFAADLLPAVESRFHTYAEKDTSPEGLKASRLHRAFGGFSMGSATTWYVFQHHLDLVSVFLPLSGDSWIVQATGGRLFPKETAKALADTVRNFGYTGADFRIYAGTGSKDPAVQGMTPQLEAMEAYSGIFDYSDDFTKGNLHFVVKEDAVHAYEEVYHHVWNYLPYLFA